MDLLRPGHGRWDDTTLTELVRYVVEFHHRRTRRELEKIEPLLEAALSRHGAAHPRLATLRGIFRELREELLFHMAEEEKILFPYAVGLDQAAAAMTVPSTPSFDNFRKPLRAMEDEHRTTAELLRALREAARDYIPPEDASPLFIDLCEALHAFEKDLREHMSFEAVILYPRALRLEDQLFRWDADRTQPIRVSPS